MKSIIITLLALLTLTTVNAQKSSTSKKENSGVVFEKGTKVAQIGIGLGGKLGLPIGASFEMGITGKIGVGAYAGFASKTYDLGTNKYTVSNIIIGARGNYHFYKTDKIDAYGGALLGYNVAKAKWKNTSNLATPSYGGVTWSGLIGARYYVQPTLAVFGELGYGIAYLTIGVSKKS
jgi:hypothetical protein